MRAELLGLLSDDAIKDIQKSGFWDQLLPRLVPDATDFLQENELNALSSLLKSEKGFNILMQFTGLAGMIKDGEKAKKLGGLNEESKQSHTQEELARKAWFKLLSLNPKNLFTILLHSRMHNEKIPADIWRMANELMFIDEIKFQLEDIQQHNKKTQEQINTSTQDSIRNQAERTVKFTADNEGRLTEIEVVNNQMPVFPRGTNDRLLDFLLLWPRKTPPTITLDTVDDAKTVLQYILEKNGECCIPILQGENISDIQALLRDFQNSNDLGPIRSFLDPGSDLQLPMQKVLKPPKKEEANG